MSPECEEWRRRATIPPLRMKGGLPGVRRTPVGTERRSLCTGGLDRASQIIVIGDTKKVCEARGAWRADVTTGEGGIGAGYPQ